MYKKQKGKTPFDSKALRCTALKRFAGPIIRALFPMATISSLDTGHWVHAERPTEFIEKVMAFIAE
jgi:pimeloyl-ACP methyl ester carboxylesterase